MHVDPILALADGYLGSASKLSNDLSEEAIIYGESDNDYFGQQVLSVGDINDDSYGDVVVSAPGNENVGSFYLFFGPISGSIDLSSSDYAAGKVNGHSISSGLNSDFGRQLSFADMDGDERGDIVVGASLHDNTDTTDMGTVFLFTELLH